MTPKEFLTLVTDIFQNICADFNMEVDDNSEYRVIVKNESCMITFTYGPDGLDAL